MSNRSPVSGPYEEDSDDSQVSRSLFLLAGRLDLASGESSPGRSRLNLGSITPLSNEVLSSSSSIKMVIELTVATCPLRNIGGTLSMLPLDRRQPGHTPKRSGLSNLMHRLLRPVLVFP